MMMPAMDPYAATFVPTRPSPSSGAAKQRSLSFRGSHAGLLHGMLIEACWASHPARQSQLR
jgi:hypothetical protein